MADVYWGCLIGGLLFTVVSVVFGDLLSNVIDGILDFLSIDVLKPMVIASAVTGFGGAGILLDEYTSFGPVSVVILSLLLSILLAVTVYLYYVKPMENSENSTAFSIQDLTAKLGEVVVPIPEHGYGEVLIKIGAGNTNQIAASFDREPIEAGARVVVVQVKDHTLYVTRFEKA